MTSPKSKVGIFGVGAIGSALAFQLSKNPTSVELSYYGRSAKDSIRLIKADQSYTIPIEINLPPFQVTHLDWLIVCIKEHHYIDAMESLFNLLHHQTKIAVIRNGLRLKDPFLKFMKEASILECMIDCPTQPASNNNYQSFGDPTITIPKGPLGKEFSHLFYNTDTKIRQLEDFRTASWKKVCESSAIGSILCLSGETCWIFQDKKLQKLYVRILEEGLAVARADGAKIERNFSHKMLGKLLQYPDSKGSSMLTDRVLGNSIELGAKNQIISELGKKYGINTPINDLIVTLLEKTNRKPI